MKIIADENIPYVDFLFNKIGNVKKVPSYMINKENIKNFDALIVRSVTKVDEDLLFNSNISFVGTTTSGIDHIDYEWLIKSNIKFSSAIGCNAISVVEYVLSAIFYLSKKYNFKLKDKTVGIIGLGNIGNLLKKILSSLEISFFLCDPILQKFNNHDTWYSIEEIFLKADIITLHVPLIKGGQYNTYHLVENDLLDLLSYGSIIINTSRGSVINNNHLLNFLKKRKDIKVVLDVWEFEPNIMVELIDLVEIGTAHIAGASIEGKIRSVLKVFNDYSKFLKKDIILSFNSIVNIFIKKVVIKYICVNNVNEIELLYLLSNLIYNIKKDDLYFRLFAKNAQGFNYLRNKFYKREWSSLGIKIDNNNMKNLLYKLGFNIYK